MNLKSFKKFISVFIVSIIILSFLVPDLLVGEIVAATVGSSTETTKKKPVGHKVPGGTLHEKLWEKYNVIAADEGGGNGQGGGASNKSHENNSSIVDVLKKLKEEIDESRAESLAKIIESALIASSEAQSVEYDEDGLLTVLKSVQSESVKNLFGSVYQTSQIQDRAGVVGPKVVEVIETKSINPTADETEDETLKKETVKISDIEPGDFVEETTVKQRLTSTYVSIEKPTSAKQTLTSTYENIANPTSEKQTVTSSYVNIFRPTTEKTSYDEISTVYSETYEVFDFPIVEEETQPLTEELSSEVSDYNETEPVVEAEEKKEESSAVVEDDEGSGSKGGKDPEAYEDKRGDEAENESKGQALEKGQLRSESEGEYAGFKVFELETNGKIGFNPDSLAVTNIRGVMIASSILLLSLGALTFIFSTFDLNKKNSYF